MTVFLLLLFKHAIVDIGIQSYQTDLVKASYASIRAHQHYAPHGIGTFLVFLIFTGPLVAIIAGLIDWVAHWHIDYVKSSVVKRWQLKKLSPGWSWATTIDQMLHYLTYYLLIVLLVK